MKSNKVIAAIVYVEVPQEMVEHHTANTVVCNALRSSIDRALLADMGEYHGFTLDVGVAEWLDSSKLQLDRQLGEAVKGG